MATPANPLQKTPSSTSSTGASDPNSAVNLMLGGMPAAGNDASQQVALGAMLGPKNNLTPYLALGGPEYAEQLDELEWNPLAAWG